METGRFLNLILVRIDFIKNEHSIMKKNLLFPNFICIPVLILLIVSAGLSGQESTQLLQSYNQESPGEKIYLHIDRPDYMQGDTIWFKAYSWYGYDQVPDTMSWVLYVYLINPEGRVGLSRKLLIENGTSQGDFSLDKNIKPGSYTIRAYTRWMEEMNNGEPFYQEITINSANQELLVDFTPVIIKQEGSLYDSLQVSFRFYEMDQSGDPDNKSNHEVDYYLKIGEKLQETGRIVVSNMKDQVFKCSLPFLNENDTMAIFGLSIHAGDTIIEKELQVPLKELIDVQFFPEGGKLVNGLKSKVAFKAIGTDGLSREVKGEIKDGSGELVTGFESFHKGMGAFFLKPEAGKEYFAYILYKQRQFKIPLPVASEEGCIMSVSNAGNGKYPYVTLKYSLSEANKQKYVVVSAYGKISFAVTFKTIKDSCRVNIPIEQLPEGVSRLTVLNSDFETECERLFYVDKNQRFTIEMVPDSSFYGTRSKVSLLIKTTGPGGVPLQTDLSLAVVDKEQITNKKDIKGISAYKLLISELKGNIEDADFYFQNDRINHSALDLLLLTQGYRKFIPANTLTGKNEFEPESSYEISGRIELPVKNTREKKIDYRNIDLLLLTTSEKNNIYQFKPDSLGRFRFQIPLLYGKPVALLQSTTQKGKPIKGYILLDDTVTSPTFVPTLPARDNIGSPSVEYVRQLQAVKKTEISKNIMYGEKSFDLGEVIVTAKSNAKYWYRNYEEEAIKIINLDSLDPEGKRYESLNELLIREFGAREFTFIYDGLKTIQLPCVSLSLDYYFPIYLINGVKYFNGAEPSQLFFSALTYLSALHVNEIKRIMVLPPGDIATHHADVNIRMNGLKQSLVEIETYSNNTYRGDPQGIKTFIINGLDAPRKFYSPQYEGSFKDSEVYDGRATLYWNPSIITDENGEAKIEFYTGDRQTSLDVITNGIEIKSGQPGQGQTGIHVGKNN
jgi:hypothetical protein